MLGSWEVTSTLSSDKFPSFMTLCIAYSLLITLPRDSPDESPASSESARLEISKSDGRLHSSSFWKFCRINPLARWGMLELICFLLPVLFLLAWDYCGKSHARGIGMENIKQLPLLRPGDSAEICPPDASIIYFTMVRPSPMPSLFTLAVLWSLPKRENSLGMSLASIPTPVSFTCTIKLLRASE